MSRAQSLTRALGREGGREAGPVRQMRRALLDHVRKVMNSTPPGQGVGAEARDEWKGSRGEGSLAQARGRGRSQVLACGVQGKKREPGSIREKGPR